MMHSKQIYESLETIQLTESPKSQKNKPNRGKNRNQMNNYMLARFQPEVIYKSPQKFSAKKYQEKLNYKKPKLNKELF